MKATRRSVGPAFGVVFLLMIGIWPAAVLGQEQPSENNSRSQPSTAMREDFTDQELQSFINANEKVMAIQVEGEQKMIKAIEDEGLTLDRFNQILEQQRDPQRGTETSPEELQSFNAAAQQILEENARIEKEMETSIQGEGIDLETYKQIMLSYQQSPAVHERVNQMVSDGNQGTGQNESPDQPGESPGQNESPAQSNNPGQSEDPGNIDSEQ